MMFDLLIPSSVVFHCMNQLKKYNFGQRGTADGNYEQQLSGIVGESLVREAFALPLVDGSTGYDDGYDILYYGLKIDVKTMGRTTTVKIDYVNNFIGLQKNNGADYYIFTSYNKKLNLLTICGWLDKETLLSTANFYKKDTIRKRDDGTTFKTFADLYEMSNDKLNQADDMQDLKNQLKKEGVEITL